MWYLLYMKIIITESQYGVILEDNFERAEKLKKFIEKHVNEIKMNYDWVDDIKVHLRKIRFNYDEPELPTFNYTIYFSADDVSKDEQIKLHSDLRFLQQSIFPPSKEGVYDIVFSVDSVLKDGRKSTFPTLKFYKRNGI